MLTQVSRARYSAAANALEAKAATLIPARLRSGRPGLLILLSVCYLAAATGIMIWRRMVVTPDYMLVLLVPVALLSGRIVRFAGDWLPFLALLLAWEAMRGFASHGGFPVHTGGLRVEQALFGGAIPTVALQHWASSIGLNHSLDPVTTVFYFLHFPVTAVIGVAFWLRDRGRFLQYTTALLVMSFAAFVVFLIFPTAPPWWAAWHGQFTGMWRIFQYTLPSTLSPFYQSLDPNPVAAVPSLHAAYPFLGYLIARQIWPRGSLVLLGWCFAIWFSVVYLGEHYVFDVLVGIAWATGAFLVVSWILRRRLQPLHAATARLAPEPSSSLS